MKNIHDIVDEIMTEKAATVNLGVKKFRELCDKHHVETEEDLNEILKIAELYNKLKGL